MALARDFKESVALRMRRDPRFAVALLDEAVTAFLTGEPDLARQVLRELVNATIGFEKLASVTGTPSKSLHRMLSPRGNPGMDNVAAILDALRRHLRVQVVARVMVG